MLPIIDLTPMKQMRIVYWIWIELVEMPSGSIASICLVFTIYGAIIDAKRF